MGIRGFKALLVFLIVFSLAPLGFANEKSSICEDALTKLTDLEKLKNEASEQFEKNKIELQIINTKRHIRKLKAIHYLSSFNLKLSKEEKSNLEAGLHGLLASDIHEENLPPQETFSALLEIIKIGRTLEGILDGFYSANKNQVWDQFLKIDFQAQYDIVRKQADDTLRLELLNLTQRQLDIFTQNEALKNWAFSVDKWTSIPALSTPEYVLKQLRTALLNPDKRYCCETTCFTCPFNYSSRK